MPPATIEVELDQVRLSALTWGPTTDRSPCCCTGSRTARTPGATSGRSWPPRATGWSRRSPAATRPRASRRDGRSDVGALMDDAVGVHAALGGDDDAVLVGHDWGGLTANALAAHRDSPFRRVVVDGRAADRGAAAARDRAATCPGRPGAAGTSASTSCPSCPSARSTGWSRSSGATGPPGTTPRPTSRTRSRPSPTRRTGARRSTTTATSRGPSGCPSRYRRWQAALADLPSSRCSTCTAATTAA